MQCNYETYFRQNCVIPTLLILFCIILIVIFIFKAVSNIHYKSIKTYEILKLAFFLLIFVFLISVNIPPLARGGIHLFFEKEKDAIAIEGQIEDTFELSWFGGSKYGVEQNHGNGEGIIINGTKYYLMTYGDLKKGNSVSIKILPKSKLILEIVPIDL